MLSDILSSDFVNFCLYFVPLNLILLRKFCFFGILFVLVLFLLCYLDMLYIYY